MIPLLLHNLESLFSWLLTASWQASVLVALVLFLQWTLRSRLNPRWHHALWLLVVVRLLLPVLPESALSLFQFTPQPPPAFVQPVTEPIFTAAPIQLPPQPQPDLPAPVYPFSLYTLLAVIWLAGVAGFLVLTALVNIRFTRQVRNTPEITDPDLLRILTAARNELRVYRPLRLIESSQIEGPAIMGLFRPTLILPEQVRAKFTDDELRFIFLHELAHLKRGDLILQWLVALLQILHWFNPVLWYAFRRMRADREPATDALVLSRTGEAEKERYGNVLIKLLEHFNQRHSLPTLIGLLEDKDQFKRRFQLIAKFTGSAYAWSLLGVFLIALLAVACLTRKLDILQKSYPLNISRSVNGTEMTINSVVYGESPIDLIRAYGSFTGWWPPKDYFIRVTVGDTPNGPASGGMHWFYGIPKEKDGPPDINRFILEIKSPPHTSSTLYWHVYFVKIDGQDRKLESETTFTTPNPARLKSAEISAASPLPQANGSGDFEATFEALETGINTDTTTPPIDAPWWISRATFSITEKGQPSNRWVPLKLTVSPDKGPTFESTYDEEPLRDGIAKVTIGGTLWKDDGPFLIDAAFYRTTDFTPDELFQLKDVPTPKPGEITPLGKEWNAFGSTVNFVGLYGTGALLPPGLTEKRALAPCLVFYMSADSSQVSENNWIQFSEQSNAGKDFKGSQRLHGKGNNTIRYFFLWDNTPDILNTYTFAMLHDPKEISFIAQPSLARENLKEQPPAPNAQLLAAGQKGDVTVSANPATKGANQQAQTYLEVDYIETTDDPALMGGVTISKEMAQTLISNPKNKLTAPKVVFVPLGLGTNTVSFKKPADVNWTVTVNWKDPLATKQQEIGIKGDWPNANGAGVSYGAQFTAELGPDDCYLVRGPWKTKENSKIIVRYVEQPPKHSQNPDAGTQSTAAKAQLLEDVRKGDAIALQKLIDQGLDPKGVMDDNGSSLLFSAGSPEVAEILLQHGLDPNATNKFGQTPLQYICMAHLHPAKIVEVLLRHGADPKTNDKGETTPLVYVHDGETMDLLIKHGVPFDLKTDGPTLLMIAAHDSRVDMLTYLLGLGVDPNVKGTWSKAANMYLTPLMVAVSGGHLETAKILLEHGAKVGGAPDSDEMTCAVLNRQKDIVKLFWDHGVHTISDLSFAITQGAPLADVQKLLVSGLPADPPQDKVIKPVGIAALLGRLDIVTLLVQRGAKVTGHFEKDVSPIDQAAGEGQDEIVAFLLQNGAQIDYEAIWNAVWNCNPYPDQRSKDHFEKTARLLIDAGALKKVTPQQSGSLLDACIGSRYPGGNATVLKMLLDAGLSPESPVTDLTGKQVSPSIIAYYRDVYAKYKDQDAALKPLLDLLEAADKTAPKPETNIPTVAPDPTITKIGSSGIALIPPVELVMTLVEVDEEIYKKETAAMDKVVKNGDIQFFRNRNDIFVAPDAKITCTTDKDWYSTGEVQSLIGSVTYDKLNGKLRSTIQASAFYIGLNADFVVSSSSEHGISIDSTWSDIEPESDSDQKFDPKLFTGDPPKTLVLAPKFHTAKIVDKNWKVEPGELHGFWIGETFGQFTRTSRFMDGSKRSLDEMIKNKKPSRLAVIMTAQSAPKPETSTQPPALNAPSPPSTQRPPSSTPLRDAIDRDQTAVVNLLLDQGAAINDLDLPVALVEGRNDIARILWDHGARQCSPLAYAISHRTRPPR